MFYRSITVRDLMKTACAVFLLLLAILLIVQGVNLLGRAAEGRIASEAIFASIIFSLLSFLQIPIIVTVFISGVVVFSRMWRESEMSVWMSSGMSLWRWVDPMLRFALPFFIISAFSTLFLTPWATERSKSYGEILKKREEISAISPGVFKENSNGSRVYFVERYSLEEGAAKNIFIRQVNEKQQNLIFAKSAYIENHSDGARTLVLKKGERYIGEAGQANFEVIAFDTYTIWLTDPKPDVIKSQGSRSLSSFELWKLRYNNTEYQVELLWRLTLPLCVLIFSVLAIPLSYSHIRSGNTMSLINSLMAVLFYLVLLIFVRTHAEQGKLSAFWLFAVHGCVLLTACFLLSFRSNPAGSYGLRWRIKND
jgi:lipopolysaccharide export system permease protein